MGEGTNLGGIERKSDRPAIPLGHIAPLTKRQAEVLALHDAGYGREKIAQMLGVTRIDNVLNMALLKSGRS